MSRSSVEERAWVPLAVVGMACRLPGARDLDEFWSLLLEGRSTVQEIPPERMSRELHYDPGKGVLAKSYSMLACLVDYPPIDTRRYPLTDSDLQNYDIAHLTAAQVAADACRHAGYDPFNVPYRRAGVYIGHFRGSHLGGRLSYWRLIEQAAGFLRDIDGIDQITGGQTGDVISDIASSVQQEFRDRCKSEHLDLGSCQAAGLISRTLGLDGPYMVVNSACASSLQALAIAARALSSEQIDMAVVGGASCFKPDTLVLFSRAQSVSSTGSRPFDVDADGLVVGEGYVVMLVKTLERALGDNDQIHAVIRGIGASCDGRGKSLWAPRKEGQIEAMRRAYCNAADMDRLQYIEAHATSTQLGDATELTALSEVLSDRLQKGARIPVGSVKCNIGHTIETAGMAGLLKTILSMTYGIVPPAVNVRQLNTTIDWEQMPFFVPLKAIEWPAPQDGSPRRAGVNSFGIGGLNLHVVVDQFAEPTSRLARVGQRPALQSASSPSSNQQEPIAIIGMGCILPGARTVTGLWDLVMSGRDPKSNVPADRWNRALLHESATSDTLRPPIMLGGFITDFQYDWQKHKLPPKQIACADLLQFMVLDAVDQALEHAGYTDKPFPRMRTGVYVGTCFSGEFLEHLQVGIHLYEFQREVARTLRSRGVRDDLIEGIVEQFKEVLIKRMPAIIDETGSYTSSTLASRITKTFNLMGGAAAIDASGASGAAALNASIDQLRAGDCDMMICAGGQRWGLAAYKQFAAWKQLALKPPSSPFDQESNGFVPGEGVGVVILKRLSDAEHDGDQIHGIIRGIGSSRSNCIGEAMIEAIGRGLKNANVTSEDIAFVETASLGVRDPDQREIAAVAECYASKRSSPLKLGSISNQVGYTGGASAIAALIKAALALNHGQMPPNLGLENPADIVGRHQGLDAGNCTSSIAENNRKRLLAGVSSTCKDELAWHIVLERGSKRTAQSANAGVQSSPAASVLLAPIPPIGDYRILRFSASSLSELAANALQLSTDPEAAFRPQTFDHYCHGDKYRLAIITKDAGQLVQQCRLAGQQLAHSLAVLQPKGIFCHERRPVKPRVVFIFPGHGSPYPGMLRSLVDGFDPAKRVMQRIDRVLVEMGHPTFADIAWERGHLLGIDVWRTQLSILTSCMILQRSLAVLGVSADCMVGHSYGEFPALVAARAWTFDAGVRATYARCQAIASCPDAKGLMMSIAAGADRVDQLIQRSDSCITISVRNSPSQTVVAGAEEEIRKFQSCLQRENITTRIVAAPCPFHSPLMKPTEAPLSKALVHIPTKPPKVPVLSSVTNRYVAEPDEIRANIVAQMTFPVNYQGLIERLYNENPNTAFVEVAPQQVLTSLNRNLLAKKEAVTIASDDEKRDGLRQLLHVRACLETVGALDDGDFAGFDFESKTTAILGINSDDGEDAERKEAPSETSALPASSSAPDDRPIERETITECYSKSQDRSVLRLAGNPYEMGLQIGASQAEAIRKVLRRYADLPGFPRHKFPTFDGEADYFQELFGDSGTQEIRGIAAGAQVNVESLVAHNLRLFLHTGAGCAHFACCADSTRSSGLIHAANEDQPLTLTLGDCLHRNVQVRAPVGGVSHVLFGVVGGYGGLNGVNARGLAVSSAMLLDFPRRCGKVDGLLQPALVSLILSHAGNLDAALDIINDTPICGAWSICLSHHPTERICYVEHNGRSVKVECSRDYVAATNHSRLQSPGAETPEHSSNRLRRLKELIGNPQSHPMTVSRAKTVLRDRWDVARGCETRFPTMNTLCRVDNHLSLIMQPASGEVWYTPGREGEADLFQLLKLGELLAEEAKPNTSPLRNDQPRIFSTQVAQTTRREEQLGKVCSRFVMRVVEAPVPNVSGGPVRLSGAALIVGKNRVADLLFQRLQGEGTKVAQLQTTHDVEQALSKLAGLCSSVPFAHLFLLNAHDQQALTSIDAATWQTYRKVSTDLPFYITQRWYESVLRAGLLDETSVVATTSLGGFFGFSGPLRSASGGAITGLVKSLSVELGRKSEGRFRAKVIDSADTDDPAAIVDSICCELKCDDEEIEVGYASGRRYVVRPIAEPITTLPREDIRPGGAWIITGGARGITAVVARELAKRFQLNLHLIGSSPIPQIDDSWRNMADEQTKRLRADVLREAKARREVPIEAWERVEKAIEIDKNLRAFAEAKIRVQYHSCDVTDHDSLAHVLERARAASGPIVGIVHAAGFESALRFEKKNPRLVERTISTKVDAAAALMSLTRDDPLEFFIAFGSVSGRFGGLGQTDYGLANDMLSKLVDWYRTWRRGVKAATFHWHLWDEVGMGVRPESRHVIEWGKVTPMSTREGAEHFIEELRAGLPEREILIMDPHDISRRSASRRRNKRSQSLAAVSPTIIPPAHRRSNTPDLSDLPLVDAVGGFKFGERIAAEIRFDPQSDPFLLQHTYKGRPILPGVIAVAAAAQATAALFQGEKHVIGLSSVEFVASLQFWTNRVMKATMRAASIKDTIACELIADFLTRAGKVVEQSRCYFRASVEVSDARAVLTPAKLPLPDVWHRFTYPEGGLLHHGEAFRGLRFVAMEGNCSWGRIVAPSIKQLAGARRGRNWIVPAVAIDVGFHNCAVHMRSNGPPYPHLPKSVKHIGFGRMPRDAEQLLAQITCRELNDAHSIYDFAIFGEDDSVIAQVDGYEAVFLKEHKV